MTESKLAIIVSEMTHFRQLKFVVAWCGLCFMLIGLTPVSASSANISHSYKASTSVPVGSIVSLDPSRSNYVRLANTTNGSQLLGVAVAVDDSLLAVDAKTGAVQVANSGTASTLVSTLNGDIKVGDQISVSPFNGVGVKALPGSHVIGLAQTAFNAGSSGARAETVTDTAGHTKLVSVGFTRLNIGVGTASGADPGAQLNGLQKLARSLTGHTVSTARVVISLVITLVAIVALITLIYASIYSGIISIGRNPLAKYAVFRTLTTVLGMALGVAIVAMITIFLLLR